jgi:phosphatidylglycerophosphatase A
MGLATLGGMGRAPLAGGTVATLVAGVPMALLVSHLHGALSLAVLGIVCVLGALGADRVIVEMGREDPGEVVVDELAGYLLTMLWLPATWTNLAAGFVLFRLLDIWKPWPIRWVDATVKGGWGAMLDDLLAGAMAHAILRLLSAATG